MPCGVSVPIRFRRKEPQGGGPSLGDFVGSSHKPSLSSDVRQSTGTGDLASATRPRGASILWRPRNRFGEHLDIRSIGRAQQLLRVMSGVPLPSSAWAGRGVGLSTLVEHRSSTAPTALEEPVSCMKLSRQR
jgi:hypothetical protein